MILSKGGGGSDGTVLLRLRGLDEDTSLWWLRCSNLDLRDQAQQLLADQ